MSDFMFFGPGLPRRSGGIIAILFLTLALFATGPARAQVDQEKTVNSAAATVERLQTNSGFQENFQDDLHKSRAVLIVPDLYKGGFIFGGQYGNGVLLVHQPDGSWSYPAFYTMEGGSVGLQIGIEDSSILFIINTDKALNAVLANQFKFGADAGVTVLIVGGAVGASTTSNMGADILAVSLSGVGLYGGLSLEGTVLSPRESWNSKYYGRSVAARAVVLENGASNPQADRLRDILGR
jgi:lipid-binding SYLF domain-containing protein